jgi:hypothetical protein
VKEWEKDFSKIEPEKMITLKCDDWIGEYFVIGKMKLVTKSRVDV